MSAYTEALDQLFVRTTGQWKLGLERTHTLLAALGNPHRALRCVHVAGTNGKGSVCAIMERVLRDRGFSVGKYTSPHLVDFRERIIINGEPVSEESVTSFLTRWMPAIEEIGATFFEATTAMAFSLFERAAPDVVILEVGLGGRLDATNVIEPLAAIVTNIGLEHTDYLGRTRDVIAGEKAGIFKSGRPAVIGERDATIRDVLLRAALSSDAEPVLDVSAHTSVRLDKQDANGVRFTLEAPDVAMTCQLGLAGTHQMWNAAVALRALESLPAPLATSHAQACPSLPRVRLAGRFQTKHDLIFDVAHNPDGAAVCAATLRAVSPPRPRAALFSVLSDKDWPGMLEALEAEVDHFVFTVAPTSPSGRAWDPRAAMTMAKERGWKASVAPDFDDAIAMARKVGKSVLITGSFHTVGDAMARLHVNPLAG